MQISEQQIGNEDLVVISVAVHLYLNSRQIKELNNQKIIDPLSRSSFITLARPKHNKWKWSFFPYINPVKDRLPTRPEPTWSGRRP